jgi:ABC-type phosphate/phosphonate transport system substrate-binding protein
MGRLIAVGAVLDDPKVSVIWELIRDYFRDHGVRMEVVFHSDYQLQVEALADGRLDMAWCSPLAWLDACRRTQGSCRAIAMRDIDRDRRTCFIVRRESGLSSIEHLRLRTIAFGAQDSPQATLIPRAWLSRNGLEAGRDFQWLGFDVSVGKHGDHAGDELEAFRALTADRAQASAMIDLNWTKWVRDGTINPNAFRVLEQTGRYDRCVLAARGDFSEELRKKWEAALFSMSYEVPIHREMMDIDGIKAWLPARTSGFELLDEAVRKYGFFASFK